VKKRTKRTRSQHENELLGLALLALGLVLAAHPLPRPRRRRRRLVARRRPDDVIGKRAYVLPVALVALGGLLLAASDLLDVRPFRLGVGVSFLGLMTLLGKDSGGFIGSRSAARSRRSSGRRARRSSAGAARRGLLLVTGARPARSSAGRVTP
jgi:hypothetical protein